MKKLIICAFAAVVLLLSGSMPVAAENASSAMGRKRIGEISRVRAMTPVGSPHVTARQARADLRRAASKYSTVNASLVFTGNSRLTDRRIYSIDPSSGLLTAHDTPEVFATGGGVLVGNRYYCMTRLKIMRLVRTRFYVFDADNWNTVEFQDNLDETLNATDVTYDATTGRVYGCFYDGPDSWSFGTIDYSTLTRTTLAACPQLNAVAADEAGNIYAINMNGTLYSADKRSGQLTRIGDTGIKAAYRSSYWQGSAVFDPASGRIIYAAHSSVAADPSDDDFIGALWSVDPITAATTQLHHFSGEELFEGLYIPREELIDEVPMAPTELTASFPAGALSGTISFRMPEKLVGGMNAGTGMEYKVKANGSLVASGNASAGESVSCDLTLERGSYCFAVTASNSEGQSREATLTMFIGVDSPAKPVVTAAYDYVNSTMTLGWTPVKTTDFGTPLPEGSVTYRITRYPEQVVVAPAHTECSYTEALSSDELKAVSYHVEAVSGGQSSGVTVTPAIYIGAVVPSYTEDFGDKDALRYYTVIDADGDRLTWECSPIDRAARIAWNNNAAADEHKDDWLISPPLRLQAGKVYKFTYGARKLYDAETLTVCLGRNPRVDAMTTVLVPTMQVTGDKKEEKTLDLTVEADGIYFIGFHATSPRTSGSLYISPFTVAEGVMSGAPAAVTAMEVVPAAERSHAATISFTAPELSMDGATLTSLAGIDLYRDGEFVATVPATPGNTGSYNDTGAHHGLNIYTLRARNDAGSGSPAERTVFVGWDEPNRAECVRARELETDGIVEVTWNAPELDNNNSVLTAEALRYDVFMSAKLPSGKTETTQVGSDVKGTSHTVTVCSPDERRFVEFYVVAKTEGGEARDVWTPEAIPVGMSYDTPFSESFANARFENFWGIYSDYVMGMTGLSWDFSDDYTFDITSQDGDNGFLVLEGSDAGDESEFYSSKINLEGLENPALTFYSYNIKGSASDDINHNIITVSAYDGTDKTVVATVDMAQYNDDGWQRISVPLSGLEGKTVQILIKGTIVNFLTIALDNIRIDATYSRNLAAESVTAPRKVMLDKSYYVYATVRNTGLEPMEAYTLDFYCDEVKLESRNGRALVPGETENHEFECRRDITSDEQVEYWCAITVSGDENAEDNSSKRTRVRVCVPNYPVVTTLVGSNVNEKPQLNWSAPDLSSSEPFEIIEDFESYPAFANSDLWDWTLFDADRAYIGGIEDANDGAIELPGIPAGSQQSWFVMDGEYEKLNFTYRAHSGRHHLATMYCYGVNNGIGYETANDDWLISPVLASGSTEMSLFARGYSVMAPDAMEILVTSESGPDPMALRYRSLGKVDPMPTSWEEYVVDLPAGTKRFAIRSVGNFGFMLFVDDITFTPAAGASMLKVEGYNVYRDGIRINEEPLTEPEYLDLTASNGDHQYGVTAVYNRGESRLSNLVSLTSAVDAVASDMVEVKAENGCVLVSGAESLSVGIYSADGRTVYATSDAAADVRVSVSAGIYLVRVAGRTFKVAVR